jgi:hypothetical protein
MYYKRCIVASALSWICKIDWNKASFHKRLSPILGSTRSWTNFLDLTWHFESMISREKCWGQLGLHLIFNWWIEIRDKSLFLQIGNDCQLCGINETSPRF